MFFLWKRHPEKRKNWKEVGSEMSGKHELAWSEGQEMWSILQSGWTWFAAKRFRMYEWRALPQRCEHYTEANQTWVARLSEEWKIVGECWLFIDNCQKRCSLSQFGACFSFKESLTFFHQRARTPASQQEKSGSQTPGMGGMPAKEIIYSTLERLEVGYFNSVCKEVCW